MTWKTTSPSQINTFRRCQRKWWWRSVMGFSEPTTPAQARGTKIHRELELALGQGIPPRDPVALAIMEHLGERRAHPDNLEWRFGEDLPGFAVPVRGIVDRVEPDANRITDFKTTSSLRYQRTEEELAVDTQAVIYSYVAVLRRGLVLPVTFRLVYGQTRGACRTAETSHIFSETALLEQIAELGEITHVQQRLAALTKAAQVPPNWDACGDYGGCPHRARCASVPQNWTPRKKETTTVPDNPLLAMLAKNKRSGSGGDKKAAFAKALAQTTARTAQRPAASGSVRPAPERPAASAQRPAAPAVPYGALECVNAAYHRDGWTCETCGVEEGAPSAQEPDRPAASGSPDLVYRDSAGEVQGVWKEMSSPCPPEPEEKPWAVGDLARLVGVPSRIAALLPDGKTATLEDGRSGYLYELEPEPEPTPDAEPHDPLVDGINPPDGVPADETVVLPRATRRAVRVPADAPPHCHPGTLCSQLRKGPAREARSWLLGQLGRSAAYGAVGAGTNTAAGYKQDVIELCCELADRGPALPAQGPTDSSAVPTAMETEGPRPAPAPTPATPGGGDGAVYEWLGGRPLLLVGCMPSCSLPARSLASVMAPYYEEVEDANGGTAIGLVKDYQITGYAMAAARLKLALETGDETLPPVIAADWRLPGAREALGVLTRYCAMVTATSL